MLATAPGAGVYPVTLTDASLGLVHHLEQLGLDAGQNDIVVVAQPVAGSSNFKEVAGKFAAVFGKAVHKIIGQGGDVRPTGSLR